MKTLPNSKVHNTDTSLVKRELFALEILKQFLTPANMYSPPHFKEAAQQAVIAADIFIQALNEEQNEEK